MPNFVLRLVALIAIVLITGQALADDWNVVRTRGEVTQLVDGVWQPLERGNVVPDERRVRTKGNGHATLTRGKETIELSPNTQIQIYDQDGRRPFTTVVEHFGTVAVEAEARNVQHFAVKNQYLAAVVKGTRFTVTAGQSGASVEVERGQVSVDDTADQSNTLIVAGQKAKVAKGRSMTVSGNGKLPEIVKKSAKPSKPVATSATPASPSEVNDSTILSPPILPPEGQDKPAPDPKDPGKDKPAPGQKDPGKDKPAPGQKDPGKDKPGPGPKDPGKDDKPGPGLGPKDSGKDKPAPGPGGPGKDKPAPAPKDPGKAGPAPKGNDKPPKGPGGPH